MAENPSPSSPAQSPAPFARATLLILLVVIAAALAFGWPTRHGEFISGDDYHFVVEHVLVNHPSLRHAWNLLTIVHGDLYQPLPMLTFQADYAVAGPDPAGHLPVNTLAFHLTNIALHALNAALACLLAAGLARRRSVGLLVGLMFAAHPFAMEPVAWISGRMILLATTFCLLLFLACVNRRADGRGAWSWLAGAAWLLALASKVMPTAPVAAAACDRHLHRRLPRRCWLTYFILLAIGLAATWAAARSTGVPELLDATQAESSTSVPVRALLATKYYLENYVWPIRLSPWSPPPKDVAFVSGPVAIALSECVVFLAAVWWTRRINRTAFLGLCLFAILLAPFLAATTARRFLAADRYMYLPIFGLHLAVGAILVQAFDALRIRLAKPLLAIDLALAILLGLGAWLTAAWRYAPVWSDTVRQARRAVALYSDDPDVWAELARANNFAKKPDMALAAVNVARKTWPDNPRFALQAGEAYRLKGELKQAEAELRVAADKMPRHARAQYYHALTLGDLGRTDEARNIYKRILDNQPDFLPAVTALARGYLAAGQFDQAAAAFERAISINPNHRDSLFELAWLMMQRKDYVRASEYLRRILDATPYDQPALLNLGAALTNLGQTDEAVAAYDRLLLVDPGSATARFNRAGLLATLGRIGDAEADYRAILKDQPDHREATVSFALLLQRKKRFADMIDLWRAYQHATDSPSRTARDQDEALAWLAWSHVLADRAAEAREIADAIHETAAARGFADWAMAYASLRAGDAEDFLRRLGPPNRPDVLPSHRPEQAQSILAALEQSDPSVRNSPISLYALARALLFAGNADSARVAAGQVLAMPSAGRWAEAARELLPILENRPSQAAAVPASRPAEENSWPR